MADFTFPATPTTHAATTTTTPEPPAVVVVASPLPAVACRPLPFPRFPVPAATSSSSPPPSPPPPAAAATTALTAMATAAAQQGPPPPGTGGGDDAAAAAAVAEVEDRMDLLWEDFNEELARGGGSCSCRAAAGRDLWPSDSSDAETEPPAVRGCAPVLRPSSRARAVRTCRRRAGTWVLLMRIFRRLFVVDKTASAAAAARARRHRAAAATRAS